MRLALAGSVALFWVTAALAQPLEMPVLGGQAVYLPHSETMMQVAAVQDVRCPSTVNCVWEGLIRVELALAVPGDTPETLVLCNSCEDGMRTGEYGHHNITLLRLEPGRDVLDPLNRPVVLEDYTVVLGVERQ